MKLAALFSGGKDSTYALHLAAKQHEMKGLITLNSKNKESYMFHTPTIHVASKQAELLNLPIIMQDTKGEKENELEDLKSAIKKAKQQWEIEGVVTGAVSSVYQATRIQKICHELELWCFNPLWQMDQIALLKELLKNKFKIMITGVFAYPLDETWLGKIIDGNTIKELEQLQKKYHINPAGEGGEFETLVINAPLFSNPLSIKKVTNHFANHAGYVEVEV